MKEITSLIYKTLENSNRDWVPKSHYPSSAGFKYKDGTVVGPDILSSFLKWTGVKPSNPPDGPAIMRMRLGDGTHEQIAKLLGNSGIKVMSEVAFKTAVPGLRHQVSGRVDGLLELRPSQLEVLEVKSANEQAMFGKGWGIESNGPKEDHLLQVICYLNNVPGVQRGRILYMSRDTGSMLEYVVEKSGDSYAVDGRAVPELSWSGIVSRWAEIEAAVASGVAPAPDYRAWINEDTGNVMNVKQINGVKHKTHWRVLYDNYRDYTWKNPDNFKYSFNATGVPSGVK